MTEMSNTRSVYVGFEGPIGAGKTTLTGLLADHLDATTILEDVDGNEFLADFYVDRERFALPMQLWFLTARHAQLTKALQAQGPLIGDYTFAKDSIFARTLLKNRDLRLYKRIDAGLQPLRQPDLVVYLDADDDILLERIARRGRPYEKPITSGYLDEIRDAYQSYLAETSGANVFRVNTSGLDLSSSIQMNELYGSILERCSRRPK
jgi:deoxyguanosine kinase